jgi:hypothetical protein
MVLLVQMMRSSHPLSDDSKSRKRDFDSDPRGDISLIIPFQDGDGDSDALPEKASWKM